MLLSYKPLRTGHQVVKHDYCWAKYARKISVETKIRIGRRQNPILGSFLFLKISRP